MDNPDPTPFPVAEIFQLSPLLIVCGLRKRGAFPAQRSARASRTDARRTFARARLHVQSAVLPAAA